MTDSDLYDRPRPDLTTSYHHAPNDDAREFAARAGADVKEEPTVDGHNIRGRYLYIRGGGAAGAVQSNVPDMARYASALMRRGAGIVRPETFDAMVAPQWCPDDRLESWGFSFQRFERFGRRIFGHGGGVHGGWSSMLLVSPSDNLALIMHANCVFDEVGKVVSRLLAAMLDAAPAPVTGATSPRRPRRRAGRIRGRPRDAHQHSHRDGDGPPADQGRGRRPHALRAPRRMEGRRAHGRHGRRGRADFFTLDDGGVEPARLALVRDASGAVTGLRCDRLVEMVRTEQVAPWA